MSTKYRNINSIAFEANQYGENPSELLTPLELMEYQKSDKSRELDFDEIIERENNYSYQQEDFLSEKVIQQKRNFVEYTAKLELITEWQDLMDLVKEIIEADYLFTQEDNKTFWKTYRLKKQPFTTAYIAKLKADSYAENKEKYEDYKTLIEEATEAGQLTTLRQKIYKETYLSYELYKKELFSLIKDKKEDVIDTGIATLDIQAIIRASKKVA